MPDWTAARFVTGASRRIAYRMDGTGHRLVLLHLLALSGAVWGANAWRLAGRFDVIAAHARGRWRPRLGRHSIRMEDLADDVCSLIEVSSWPACTSWACRWAEAQQRTLRACDLDRVGRMVLGLGHMHSRALLPGIRLPVLVLTGAEDYAKPSAKGQFLASSVRDGTAVYIAVPTTSLVEDPGLAGRTEGFLAAGAT